MEQALNEAGAAIAGWAADALPIVAALAVLWVAVGKVRKLIYGALGGYSIGDAGGLWDYSDSPGGVSFAEFGDGTPADPYWSDGSAEADGWAKNEDGLWYRPDAEWEAEQESWRERNGI